MDITVFSERTIYALYKHIFFRLYRYITCLGCHENEVTYALTLGAIQVYIKIKSIAVTSMHYKREYILLSQ